MQDVLKIISPVYICIFVDSPDCSSELNSDYQYIFESPACSCNPYIYIDSATLSSESFSGWPYIAELLIASNVYGIYTPFTIYIVDSPVF